MSTTDVRPLPPVFVERHFSGPSEATLRGYAAGSRVVLTATIEDDEVARLDFDPNWEPDPWRISDHWGLDVRLPDDARQDDVFRIWHERVTTALRRAVRDRLETATGREATRLQAYLHGACGAIAELTADATIRSIGHCDPEARYAALGFPHAARLWVYRRLREDGSGRLAQLASTCPGALLFAAACATQDAHTSETARIIVTSAVEGIRLNRMLDTALREWATALMASPRSRRTVVRTTRARLQHAAREHRLDALLAQQRLLIRRAVAQTPPELLFLPPPVRFAAEDIPSSIDGCVSWFVAAKSHHALLQPPRPADREVVEAISAFVSANAREIAPPSRGSGAVRRDVRLLIAWARESGRRPSRRSDAAAILADARAGHGNPPRDAGHAARDTVRTQDQELPPPPAGSWQSPDGAMTVTPIRTTAGLKSEGRTMRHCVAGRASHALRRRCWIYHADGPVPRGLTIEIVRARRGHYAMVEVRGRRNRLPTSRERRLLGLWLAWVNQPQRAPQTDRVAEVPAMPRRRPRRRRRERARGGPTQLWLFDVHGDADDEG